jgi:hypothetical protein
MGYFDGLASGIFKKNKQNQSVYYPWGVLGKGYVLPDTERETAIKNMVIMFYQLFFAILIMFFIIFNNMLTFGIGTLGLVVWFLYKSKQLTKDCPVSTEKLTLKEGYTNSAKAHNMWVLYALLAVSVIFTLIGLVLLIGGRSVGAGLFLGILFGACCAAFVYMIRVKKQQANSQS